MAGQHHVALLRGINVGGKNKLPMKDLAAMFADAGCTEVETFIQSGNVLFGASAALARRVPGLITEAIATRLHIDVPIVTRSHDDLRAVVAANPFLRAGDDPDMLHVMFLSNAPTAPRIKALDPNRSPGDRFEVLGRDLYLCLPNGVARSKLTNDYFDRTLQTTSTMRNWRTTLKLLELLDRR